MSNLKKNLHRKAELYQFIVCIVLVRKILSFSWTDKQQDGGYIRTHRQTGTDKQPLIVSQYYGKHHIIK